MAVLKIRDENGVVHEILALKGEKGDKGEDGTVAFDELTDGQRASLKGEKGERGASIVGVDYDAEEDSLTFVTDDYQTLTAIGPIRGPKGDTGPQGEKGDTGPQGEKGDTGPKGDTGAQGIQGIQGEKGDNGYTPQRGVDYYTEDDKNEMVSLVLAALPNGDEVAY